jgi:hypothetical protein
MNTNKFGELVLSISGNTKGFAFTLFEAPLSPIDWGWKDTRGGKKNAKAMEMIRALVASHHPEVLVIEDPASKSYRRSLRIRNLSRLIGALAKAEGLEFAQYSREQLRRSFYDSGAMTRLEIAQAIATYLPAFKPWLPPVRKPWMSEDIRYSIFDAAALALTYYADLGGPSEDEPP